MTATSLAGFFGIRAFFETLTFFVTMRATILGNSVSPRLAFAVLGVDDFGLRPLAGLAFSLEPAFLLDCFRGLPFADGFVLVFGAVALGVFLEFCARDMGTP